MWMGGLSEYTAFPFLVLSANHSYYHGCCHDGLPSLWNHFPKTPLSLIARAYFSADCNEQTLSGSQLQLLFIKKQAECLQQFAVFSNNVIQRHPVNIACQGIQCCSAYSAVCFSLFENTWVRGTELKLIFKFWNRNNSSKKFLHNYWWGAQLSFPITEPFLIILSTDH